MPIWKDKKYYLQAEKNFKYYDPDPDLKPFKTTFRHVNGGIKDVKGQGKTISSFNFSSSPLVYPRGPIYFDDGPQGNERKMCERSLNSAQSHPKGSQFVFKKPQTTTNEYALLSLPADLVSDWWSDIDSETCFIKVIIRGTANVAFMATSYKKDDQSHTDKYGFTLGCQGRLPLDQIKLSAFSSGAQEKMIIPSFC